MQLLSLFSTRCGRARALAAVIVTTVVAWNAGGLNADELAEGKSYSGEVSLVSSASLTQSVTVKTCFGKEAICVAPEDEIWIVNAQHACGSGCLATEFHTHRLQGSQWKVEDLSTLAQCHQTDLSRVTVVVIHGNNTDNDWAIARGMQFYERIFYQDACSDVPVRLVILSWQSERVRKRPIPDYKIKSTRAVNLGPAVGFLLEELGGDRPVLTGYSLGVQVVLSTMTHLADRGDANCGCQGYRIALIAPALDDQYACNCLNAIPFNPLFADTEIFVNRYDRVLLAARLMNRKRCENRTVEPSLVGLLEQGRLPADRFHLDDVTKEVRNRHSLVNYIQAKTVQRKIRGLVLKAAADRGVATEVSDATLAKPTESSAASALNAPESPR